MSIEQRLTKADFNLASPYLQGLIKKDVLAMAIHFFNLGYTFTKTVNCVHQNVAVCKVLIDEIITANKQIMAAYKAAQKLKTKQLVGENANQRAG